MTILPAWSRQLSMALLLGATAMSAQAADAPRMTFENVTASVLDQGGASDYRFDALWTDFNGDGCPDPFVFGHADPATSRLWLNRCDGSGHFTRVENRDVHYYIAQPQLPMGAGWVSLLDFDGDGREDFWLRHANIMAARYLNATSEGQVRPVFSGKQDGCADACTFGDIDGDGRLDIVHPDRRITAMRGGASLYPASGAVAEALIADLDGDSWPDLAQPAAHGYWSNHQGKLAWQATGLDGGYGPKLAADLDADGDADLFTASADSAQQVGRVHLFRNDGNGGFTDVAAAAGLESLTVYKYWTGYGNAVATDLDNDGLPEIITSGFSREPSVLVLRNLGNLQFRAERIDFGAAGSGSEAYAARVAVADYDADGLADIVKTQAGSNIGIWRNTTATKNHWLQVRLRGAGRNTDAVGAVLRWRDPATQALIGSSEVQVGPQHPPRMQQLGLGSRGAVDLDVRFPHNGAHYRFAGVRANQSVLVSADGCLQQRKAGAPIPTGAAATCAMRGTVIAATPPPARMDAQAAVMDPETAERQRIELHRNGASGDEVMVSVGIPLPPGRLTDARLLRILDEEGREIPAQVEPMLRWHFKDDSIRAVRAQFRTTLASDTRRLHFALGTPRTRSAPGWAYADALVDGPADTRVPGVLATLDPQWLCDSLIAGPQQPADAKSAYDRYVATQFKWAQALPAEDPIAWLFDRPSTLFKQYVRNGKPEYLEAAIESYRFYMRHLRRTGAPGWPECGGGWSMGKVDACDSKFVYIEPVVLAMGLVGDDSLHDPALIERMVGAWDTGGWNLPAGAYAKAEQPFTERVAGLGLLATVAAFELTGEARYRTRIEQRIDWLYAHQSANPDGLGNDGSWRHSWQRHEGGDYDPATDVRGASPWMSENIIDGLWHAWQIKQDPRIAEMIRRFGHYLEEHGWIKPELFAQAGHSWRDPCSGAQGQIAWYWSSSQAAPDQLIRIQDSEGWYSDAHNVELALAVAAARYFERDPARQRALDERLQRLESSYREDCASSSATPRRFNWNNRGAAVVQWLRRHFDDQPIVGAADTERVKKSP